MEKYTHNYKYLFLFQGKILDNRRKTQDIPTKKIDVISHKVKRLHFSLGRK